MSMDVADLNRDGFDDFLVVDMLSRDHRRRMTQRNTMYAGRALTGSTADREQYPRNTLFMNRGDGTFAEIAQYAGLEAPNGRGLLSSSMWIWMGMRMC